LKNDWNNDRGDHAIKRNIPQDDVRNFKIENMIPEGSYRADQLCRVHAMISGVIFLILYKSYIRY